MKSHLMNKNAAFSQHCRKHEQKGQTKPTTEKLLTGDERGALEPNLRGGPWNGRSRRAPGVPGRRRRAPSWAAATRTPRASIPPSCAAARPGAAPAPRHSPSPPCAPPSSLTAHAIRPWSSRSRFPGCPSRSTHGRWRVEMESPCPASSSQVLRCGRRACESGLFINRGANC